MVEVSTDKVDAEVPAPATAPSPRSSSSPTRRSRSASRSPRSIPERRGGPRGGAPTPTTAASPKPRRRSRGRRRPTARRRPPTTPRSPRARTLEGGGLEIVMPEMGESVTEGTVLEWHVAEGDAVEEGQTVVEVSTDKVDAEVPAPFSGHDHQDPGRPDETVEVGKPLAEMTKGDAGADEARCGARRPEPSGRAPIAPAAARGPRRAAPTSDAKATPVAKRVAAANGVDLGGVKGIGRRRQGDEGRRARARRRQGRPRRPPAADGRGQGRCAARPRCSPRRWRRAARSRPRPRSGPSPSTPSTPSARR